MKKIISLFAFVLVISMIMSAFTVTFAAEEAETGNEEAEYVHFTSTSDYDPYATFTFSEKGNNSEIDPDKVRYVAIRYRTITLDTEKGIELGGQLYVVSPKEPYVPIVYNHTGNWETTVVDLTTISVTKSDLETIWDSDNYTDTTKIRFDMMEPNREDPEFDNDNDRGRIRNNSEIDVAWLAFFETEEDAKAYTGTETTPYCIVDAECLAVPDSTNNVKATHYKNGSVVDDGVLEQIDVNPKLSSGSSPISIVDHEVGILTMTVPDGYVIRDIIIRGCPTWGNTAGDSDTLMEAYIWKGDYDTTLESDPVASVELLDHPDNKACDFNFGTALRYGHEYLLVWTASSTGKIGFYTGDVYPEGSGWTAYFDGYEEDVNLPLVSYTLLEVGEIPDYDLSTPEPTEAPTAAPATEVPTEAPTTAPTAAPTAAPTKAPEAEEGNSSSIVIIIIAAVVIVAAVLAIIFVKKKKK